MIETLLALQRPDWGVLLCGWLPLDAGTFAMYSSHTVKEGVGRNGSTRRWLKTVMQKLACRAERLITLGRKLILRLGANDRLAKAFAHLNSKHFGASTERRS